MSIDRSKKEPTATPVELASAPKLSLGIPLALGSMHFDALLPDPSGSEAGQAGAGPVPAPLPATDPSAAAKARVDRLIEGYTAKSGTVTHPDPSVTEGVKLGLAHHIDELKRPLCPCRFYPDKTEEAQHRTWMCPCDDMQIYKYCHCLLFTDESGKPITEHLPANHEGRRIWGTVEDPDPSRGRALKARAAEREEERLRRRS